MGGVREERHRLLRQKEERAANAVLIDIEAGDNYYRFLPPWSAALQWKKEAWFHHLFKAGILVNGKKSTVCLQKSFNQPCALCEQVEQLYQMGKTDPEAAELAKEMRAKQRFFANVLDIKKNDGKVYILPFGQKLYERLVEIMDGGTSPDGNTVFGVGDITDVQTGRMIMVTKTVNPKDKKLTDYGAKEGTQPQALANAQAVCAALHNLDEFVFKDAATYDQMKAAINGTEAPASPASPAPAAAAPAGPPPGFSAPAPAPAPAPTPAPAPAPNLTSEFMPPPGSMPAPTPAPASPDLAAQFGAPPAPAPAAPAASKPSSALDRLKAMNAGKK